MKYLGNSMYEIQGEEKSLEEISDYLYEIYEYFLNKISDYQEKKQFEKMFRQFGEIQEA
jgi:flagellin-specific chaperone FliS